MECGGESSRLSGAWVGLRPRGRPTHFTFAPTRLCSQAMKVDARSRLTHLGLGKAPPNSAMLLLAVAMSAGSLSAQGRTFWQEGGVVVCDRTWGVGQAAAPDGTGGAFVVWSDTRTSHGSVWAQQPSVECGGMGPEGQPP